MYTLFHQEQQTTTVVLLDHITFPSVLKACTKPEELHAKYGSVQKARKMIDRKCRHSVMVCNDLRIRTKRTQRRGSRKM